MKPKDRIILLRKQLRIAEIALKQIRDGNGSIGTASLALDAIERIDFVEGARE